MALKIEDYALIGDCETAALVGKNGSIDWLCWPDFASPACFAALVGTSKNGRWLLGPRDAVQRVTRRYLDHTLILETTFETNSGVLVMTDFMPVRQTHSDIVRIVKCVRGTVPMQMELCVRFHYGHTLPWVGPRQGNSWAAAAGTGVVYLRTQQQIHTQDATATAHFTLRRGEQRSFVLTYASAEEAPPRRINAETALQETSEFWQSWCRLNQYEGPWKDAVERSLITLKALTYRPTGGIVAAPTTSLPERVGGDKNWDYRFCWLRDGAFTLEALLSVGHRKEARAWQEWLLQSVGSDVGGMRIMYGVRGERHLPECPLPWLQGYRRSQPVRIGNAAAQQVQLDVYGQVANAIASMARAGIDLDPRLSRLQLDLTNYVTTIYRKPSSGLWERRNRKDHYTYSKAMAWLALRNGAALGGREAARWKREQNLLHRQICRRGFNNEIGSFVQTYGSSKLDASVLLLPVFGFLPFEDERVKSTMVAIQKRLSRDGLIYRYLPTSPNEEESAFLACSFWMVENLVGTGRRNEAETLFQRLLRLQNDVGLLSEEYDPDRRTFRGNFPQALSHIALVRAAQALADH